MMMMMMMKNKNVGRRLRTNWPISRVLWRDLNFDAWLAGTDN
jgi:hypothetical protein